MIRILLPALLALLAAACSASKEPVASDGSGEPATTTTSEPKAQTVAIPSAVREVRCGCKIDGVGKCGNYVAVDGEWLEIGNPHDHGLGKMEWCGATGAVEAQVAGERATGGILVSELDVQ